MRRLTDFVSDSFIWGVGITRPEEGQRRFAALYICACLALTILGVAGFFLFMVTLF